MMPDKLIALRKGSLGPHDDEGRGWRRNVQEQQR